MLATPAFEHNTEEIHVTLANLLRAIPEISLQRTLWEDLMNMIVDLGYAVGEDELLCFEQTVAASTTLEQDFILNLDSRKAARQIQISLCNILHHMAPAPFSLSTIVEDDLWQTLCQLYDPRASRLLRDLLQQQDFSEASYRRLVRTVATGKHDDCLAWLMANVSTAECRNSRQIAQQEALPFILGRPLTPPILDLIDGDWPLNLLANQLVIAMRQPKMAAAVVGLLVQLVRDLPDFSIVETSSISASEEDRPRKRARTGHWTQELGNFMKQAKTDPGLAAVAVEFLLKASLPIQQHYIEVISSFLRDGLNGKQQDANTVVMVVEACSRIPENDAVAAVLELASQLDKKRVVQARGDKHMPLDQWFTDEPRLRDLLLDSVDAGNSHQQKERVAWLNALTGRKASASSIGWDYVSASTSLNHEDPLFRLLFWQTCCWLAVNHGRELESSVTAWMVRTACADTEDIVRDFASKEIGKLFEVGTNGVFDVVDQIEPVSRNVTRVLLAAASASAVDREISYRSATVRLARELSAEDTAGCFFEISRFAFERGELVPQGLLNYVIPVFARDMISIEDDESSRSRLEHQFRLLEAFLCKLLSSRGLPSIDQTVSFYDRSLPYILGQLVVDKNYNVIKNACGFKLYLQARKRKDTTISDRAGSDCVSVDPNLVLGNDVYLASRIIRSSGWTRRLPEQTCDICLAPFFIERILPPVLLHAGRDEIHFFIHVVLQSKVSLTKILASREQLILKGLVLGLTRDRTSTKSASRALRNAALARKNNLERPKRTRGLSSSGESSTDGESDAIEWITSHFMYLLVNAVQHRWVIRTLGEKVHAMRCLSFMLNFLESSESPKYISQVMASVNASISVPFPAKNSAGSWNETHQLRFLAVEVMSTLVNLVAQASIDILGHHLTLFVVALIPVLDDRLQPELGGSIPNACQAAVGILHRLTTSTLGQELARFFKDIPFLPPVPILDPVRTSLRKFGVDFDNLELIGTQCTQNTSQIRGSDTNSVGMESTGTMSTVRQRLALRRRLEMLTPLLADENSSIRRAVIDHLTSLLRGNRDLFQALVETEVSTSMKRFVTVPYPKLQGKHLNLY